MKPLVSVIVLTYNQETMVAQTLESIISQQGADCEVIVGEDCSTDGTRAICEEYAARYPDVVRLMPAAPNKGLMCNYADSLAAARGKYVAACAGDDWWNGTDSLARRVAFLEDNPEYGMVHTNYDVLDVASGKVEKSVQKGFSTDSPSPTYAQLMSAGLDSSYPGPLTALIRRELMERHVDMHNYIAKGFMMEDLPMWLELSQHTKFGFMDFSSATYRRADGSAGNNYSDFARDRRFRENALAIKLYFLEKYPVEGVTRESLLQPFYGGMAVAALRSGNTTEEKEYLAAWKPTAWSDKLRKFFVVCPGLRQLYRRRLRK